MNAHVVCHHFMSNVEPYYFRESDVGQAFIRTKPHYIKISGKSDWSFGFSSPTVDSIRKSAMILVEYHHDYLKMKKRDGLDVYELGRTPENNWDDGNWISVEKCIKIFPTVQFETKYVSNSRKPSFMFGDIRKIGVVGHYYMSNVEPYYFRESDVGQSFIRTRPFEMKLNREFGNRFDWSYGVLKPTINSIIKSAVILVEYHRDYLEIKDGDYKDSHKLKRTPEDRNWDDGNWISVEKCIEIFSTIQFKLFDSLDKDSDENDLIAKPFSKTG